MRRTMRHMIGLLVLCILFVLPVNAAVPTRQTDVTTASGGNALIKIRGNFYTVPKETVLKRINEIRYEACQEGVINPSTGKKLTLSDYKPLKWSSDLEWIAQTRAAEAAVYDSHTRPNGSICFSCSHNGQQSWAEDLAWNWSGILGGIEQWYEEKADWVAQNPNAVTGHYTSMIATGYNHIAVGCFQTEAGEWYTVAAEFSDATGLDETQVGVSGLYDQVIEVSENEKGQYAKYIGCDHNLVKTSAKASTYTSAGNTTYYTCSKCGKYFSDAAGRKQIEKGDWIISKLRKSVQPMAVKAVKKTVKASKLRKNAQKIKPITVKSAQGPVTYKITGGNKKSKKALKINAKTGKITVKKKTKKGIYKVKVTVTAAGNNQYKSGSKTVDVSVKVK